MLFRFPFGKYHKEDFHFFDNIENEHILSPWSHIGLQNVTLDIEPFEGLVYLPSLDLAKSCVEITKIQNSYIIKNEFYEQKNNNKLSISRSLGFLRTNVSFSVQNQGRK